MNTAVTVLLLLAAMLALGTMRVEGLPSGMINEELIFQDPDMRIISNMEAGEEGASDVTRTKRATCDLFSFNSKWVTPNHAACAAHCLVRGKKGGSCKNAICYCRN